MKTIWFHGLAAAFIGGASGSISSGMALMVMVPEKFNLGPDLALTLKTIAILGVLTGAQTAFAYLKQAPLPEWEGEDRRVAPEPLVKVEMKTETVTVKN